MIQSPAIHDFSLLQSIILVLVRCWCHCLPPLLKTSRLAKAHADLIDARNEKFPGKLVLAWFYVIPTKSKQEIYPPCSPMLSRRYSITTCRASTMFHTCGATLPLTASPTFKQLLGTLLKTFTARAPSTAVYKSYFSSSPYQLCSFRSSTRLHHESSCVWKH